MNGHNSKRISKVWVFWISALIIYYLFAVWSNATNSPFRLDDSITFIDQFNENYLNQSFGSKMDYLLSPAIYPHPKITLRIVSILSYWITGGINFAVLRYLTAFCVILFGLSFWRLSNVKENILLFVPFFALLLIPNITNTWVVILGNTITSLLVLFTSYSLIKGRIPLACLFGFLLTFNGPTGMFIFPIGFVILFALAKTGNAKYKISDYIIWLVTAVTSIYLFTINVFKSELPEGRNDGSLNIESVSDLFGILQLFFDNTFLTIKNTFNVPSFVLAILGSVLLLFVTYKVFKALLEKNTSLIMPFTVLIYYLALVGVISLFSYDNTIQSQTLYTRYECYSNYIFALLVFVLLYTKKPWTKIDFAKVFVFILFAIPLQIIGYKSYYEFSGKKIDSAFERRLQLGMKSETYIKKQIKKNLFDLDTAKEVLENKHADTKSEMSWIKEYKSYRELLYYRKAIENGTYSNERISKLKGFDWEYLIFHTLDED